jgi:hypothetical protein
MLVPNPQLASLSQHQQPRWPACIMESSYPTPSPSSHASSILRAALGTPTPSPHHSPTPTHDTAANTVDSSVDNNSPPPQRPVYNMFGLDFGASDSSSTIGDSEANQRSMEPPYKRIQPLVLPPRRHIITVSPNVKPRAASHSVSNNNWLPVRR